MSGKTRGLGEPESWLGRASAEADMYKPSADEPAVEPATAPAEQPARASRRASKSARKVASIPASNESKGGSSVPTAVAAEGAAPPPPPARTREQRVQFNHRILSDRDQLLQKYKQRHNTTMQAIVDQMVDEYLVSRGLLDK